MFHNPALDVAIGMVFIYAVYSLLATTFSELISSFLGLRGRMLRDGIMRMLNDDSIRKIGKRLKEKNSLPEEKQAQENEKEINKAGNEMLSDAFLNRPEILFLGRRKTIFRFRSNRPSYIKPSTFSKGLLNTLKEKCESEGVETNEGIESLKAGLKSESPTHRFLIDMINEAGGKTGRFRSLAEDWFNETMDRVLGWYKRWTQLITFVVAFFIAFSMNVDTIAWMQKSNKSLMRLPTAWIHL